jgi:hypothetical protein
MRFSLDEATQMQVKATGRFWKRAIELTKTLNRPP